jgi:LmbE family N-acetylglucosaminyl deacetylase
MKDELGERIKRVALVVAHPDDETLWAGGTILLHPGWSCFIVALCRASDADRAPRFFRALECLGAKGAMADLDDGPEQLPLAKGMAEKTLLGLLPSSAFDLVLTHGPKGEYTSHVRHEETAGAVAALAASGRLRCREIFSFSYEDGGGAYLPKPRKDAEVLITLPEEIWREKYRIITQVYGFSPERWEARTTPGVEAFAPLPLGGRTSMKAEA